MEGVETVGNGALNATLERSLDSQSEQFVKPNADTGRAERERFIRAKYELKQFASEVAEGGRQLGIQRQVAVRVPTNSSTAPASSSTERSVNPPSAAHRGMIEFVGVLMIRLVEASDLAGMNISGKSDPYVTLTLGEQTVSSKHVTHNVNPQWNEMLMLSWDGASPLLVELFDRNTISADRGMGAFQVSLSQLAPLLENADATIDEWFAVKMPKEWASNFGEHLVAGAEGVGRGFYRGITGVWKDPIKGAKENGFGGFAKGVGTGVAGVVYRPIKGFGTMVKQTASAVGVGKSKRKKHKGRPSEGDDQEGSEDEGEEEEIELVAAGKVHLVLSLQRFT